ncbi:hypothetical protein EYF80_052712 [Liparis tanakae]|uniref:Uncharacterized protein n=1 Tax=Liparis tanakae TaxID=230148 RepID=A0A4Z2F790_9TELE|nr:hypothetical protein EYF80_052712 [Liparis tanakae]
MSQRRYLSPVPTHTQAPSSASATGSCGRETSLTTSHLSTPTAWTRISFLRLEEVTISTHAADEPHTSNRSTCWILLSAATGSRENMLRASVHMMSSRCVRKPRPTSVTEHWLQLKHSLCHWRSSKEMYLAPARPATTKQRRVPLHNGQINARERLKTGARPGTHW